MITRFPEFIQTSNSSFPWFITFADKMTAATADKNINTVVQKKGCNLVPLQYLTTNRELDSQRGAAV